MTIQGLGELLCFITGGVPYIILNNLIGLLDLEDSIMKHLVLVNNLGDHGAVMVREAWYRVDKVVGLIRPNPPSQQGVT